MVIGKAIGLLRRYLVRYQPSQEVIQLIIHFCRSASESIGASCSEVCNSLRYLRCLVSHVNFGQTSSSAIPTDESMGGRSGMIKSGLWPTDSGEASELSSSQTSGVYGGSLLLGRTSQQLVAGSAAGSSCGSENTAIKRITSAPGPLQQSYEPYHKVFAGSTGSPLSGVDWHVQQSNGSKGCLSNMLAQEMLKFRPPLAWIEGVDDGNPPEEEDGWLAVTGIQGVSSPEHLWAVAGDQKLQNQVEFHRSSSMAGGVSLFQYRHYTEQEPLNLNADETSAVVEGVCGPRAAGTEDNPIWSEEDDIWAVVEEPLRPVGQVCANLLVKMVIDLWLKIGPTASYPLVLQMLHQCIKEEDPCVRAQAFDVVYNLSIHARMLVSSGDDLDAVEDPWEQHAAETRWVPTPSTLSASPLPSCTTPMSDRVPSNHRLHPLQEEPEEVLPRDQSLMSDQTDTQKETASAMDYWLQVLLFDLMILITQEGEKSEVVWSSAVGCFLHTTTCRGQFMWSKLTDFPLQVVSTLLRRCADFGWSDELYFHLLQLPVNLLYLPDMQQAGPSKLIISEERFNQFGGIPELLFHFQACKSVDALGDLVRLLIDFAAKQAGCNSEILAPLVAGLLSPGALEVVLSTVRQGESALTGLVQIAIQNCVRDCVVEQGPEQGSPLKQPHHQNVYSQSSVSLSETQSSTGSFMEPESLDSWKAVLSVVDILFMPSRDESLQLAHLVQQSKATLERMINDSESSFTAWGSLRELLGSGVPVKEAQGLRWIAELLACLSDVLSPSIKGDSKSLLPDPPTTPWDIPVGNCHPIHPFICEWLSQEHSSLTMGQGFTLLIDQLFSRLFSPKNGNDGVRVGSGVTTGKREGVIVQGQTLFKTISSALGWVKLMPIAERRRPLLSISNCIFKTIHAPVQMAPPLLSTPVSGQQAFRPFTYTSTSGSYMVPSPGQFIYDDLLNGSGAIYIKLLRLVPTDLLVGLMEELDEISPAYAMPSYLARIGFHGRPGYKNLGRASHTNVPWSDTVSDVRAAVVLLLLHRLVIDKKGEGMLKSRIKSLLNDSDVRVRYFASRHLLKQAMHEKPAECRRALQQFVAQAQQINNELLVDNPYLQFNHILEIHITE